jgi:hypothetical protein
MLANVAGLLSSSPLTPSLACSSTGRRAAISGSPAGQHGHVDAQLGGELLDQPVSEVAYRC